MVGSVRLLVDGQRAADQWLGLCKTVRGVEQLRQSVKGGSHSWMFFVRAYARGELSVLDDDIRDVLASAQLNRPTRFHLEDARRQITRSLDPTLPPPAPKPAPEAPSFPLRIHLEFCDIG